LIWIVPLVALAVAAAMLHHEWSRRGPEIEIEFADGSGIEIGQTRLEYKGVPVGRVTGVTLNPDLSHVIVRLRLDRSAAPLARRGAEFWIVHPEIGPSGVRGLETLVSGVHLNVRPGQGEPAKTFRGLDQPPAIEKTGEGRAFVLLTDNLGTLVPRAPVLYRDIKVGEVETVRLGEDATTVVVRVRVETPYMDLVRVDTRFWSAGGVPLRFNLFGGKVETASLQSLITGAIAFATPEPLAAVAAEGAVFSIHAKADDEWRDWKPKVPILFSDKMHEPAGETMPQTPAPVAPERSR
jgi:paraquat-inducible protein B